MAPEDALYRDPALADFYDIENGWAADMAFCANLAEGRGTLLDLGCGTGELAATLAMRNGMDAVGVDPARAMLDVASARPGGDQVRWIEGDARSVRIDRRFDLIVLTGHAFQVFLTAEDRAQVLKTIAAHLSPDGLFIFDSRNPDAKAWEQWTPALSTRKLDHPNHGVVTAWNEADWNPETEIVTYRTFYRIERTGMCLSAQSQIAFAQQASIAEAIASAGLQVERWIGDWDGGEMTKASPDIIPLGRLASGTS